MIVVCGDSFCSRDPIAVGKHFSEQLEGPVVNLARGGISNSAIFMQLFKALAMNPSVVIYSSTDPARMTVPASVNGPDFNASNPIANIRYEIDGTEPFVSHTIPSILGELELGLDPEVKAAVKAYFTTIYDPEMQSFLDNEMFQGYESRCREQHIQVIRLNRDVKELYEEAWELRHNSPDVVYHTSAQAQTHAAKKIMEIIKNGN
jgi:hypothetical protein